MKTKLVVLLFISLFMFSCAKESSDNALLSIRLTDAPAEYDSVLIDVVGVEIHYANAEDDGGWMTLQNFNQGIYNLLDFSNGRDTLLVSTEVVSGKISQIRLILGTQNSIVVDGISYDLTIPSAYTSGLKINLHESLEPGIEKQIWLDFIAAKSIVKNGTGQYHLKPVIRAYTIATSGAIKGTVVPKVALPEVFVVDGSDTISTIADTTGYFCIGGVPEGTYTVHFKPVEPYLEKEIDNVAVTNGSYTDLGEVELSDNE